MLSLKNDIEELLKLTEDNINSLQNKQPKNEINDLPDDDPFSKEYALFKVSNIVSILHIYLTEFCFTL